MMVVVTFKFSTPSTLTLGVEVLTDKPVPAETATAEAMRVVREARREKENIVVQVAKAVDEKAPIKPKALRPSKKSGGLK